MRKMARRAVDCLANARSRRLNAGQSYRFQLSFSFSSTGCSVQCAPWVPHPWEPHPLSPRQRVQKAGAQDPATTKNHQPHSRVVACFTTQFKNLIRQAPYPASALWPLIRSAAGVIAMAQNRCMTLIRVEQESPATVKRAEPAPHAPRKSHPACRTNRARSTAAPRARRRSPRVPASRCLCGKEKPRAIRRPAPG